MFFLDINDDVGLAQFFRQSEILATQLLHFNCDGIAFHFAAPALGGQALPDTGGPFPPPTHKRRGIQPFAPEQGADAAGAPRLVGFG